jgi:hypothetical protein
LLIGAAVGLVLGVLLGMALFWGPFPLERTDAHPYDLAPDARAEYVALVADSYKLDRDFDRAAKLLQQWTPEEKQQAFAEAVRVHEEQGRVDKALAVRDLALVLGVSEEPLPQPTEPPGLLSPLRVPCLVFFVVLLALVLAWLGLRELGKRRSLGPVPTARAGFTPIDKKSAAGPAADSGAASRLGKWITTYNLGEDAYDESFPVETADGDYLGECGVGISEVVGESEPDKVVAFEVWLFDKSDIRTVTKVLMSDYAFHDEALRSRLTTKGEAILAQPGTTFALETSGLQVQALVSDLEYGKADPEPSSFFSKLTVELTATAKSDIGDAALA